MRYTVYCDGLTIGHTAFEARDGPSGIVRGTFVPAAEYALVRSLFRALAAGVDGRLRIDDNAEALLRVAYSARDQLRLTVSDEAGESLPLAALHLEEPASPSAPIEIIARLAVPARRGALPTDSPPASTARSPRPLARARPPIRRPPDECFVVR